jgi:hypothetical protein
LRASAVEYNAPPLLNQRLIRWPDNPGTRGPIEHMSANLSGNHWANPS